MIEDVTQATISNHSKNKIKMNNRLPKIILPFNKLKMFADWWDSDIRFEKEVPHAFEEGYLIIDNEDLQEYDVNKYSFFIKSVARSTGHTYREIETEFKEFLISMEEFTLYFKFISADSMIVYCYDRNGCELTSIELDIGEGNSKYDMTMEGLRDKWKSNENAEKALSYLLQLFMRRNVYYLVTCLWYIASCGDNTKYVYEETKPIITGRHKGVVQVSDTKYIRTPVYDMSKIKTIRVEKLIARKKGWTYSHSFQVHGHYRHYKNGNVIFINSFIKGKGKPFKAQEIILEPDVIKE